MRPAGLLQKPAAAEICTAIKRPDSLSMRWHMRPPFCGLFNHARGIADEIEACNSQGAVSGAEPQGRSPKDKPWRAEQRKIRSEDFG